MEGIKKYIGHAERSLDSSCDHDRKKETVGVGHRGLYNGGGSLEPLGGKGDADDLDGAEELEL